MVDIPKVARALRDPVRTISGATGRARFIAVQRFLRALSLELGQDPVAALEALDALLPIKGRSGWHVAGQIVAGSRACRHRRGPTLSSDDLHRVVAASEGHKPTFRAARDRALVALQCFSGLRVRELLTMQWEDIGSHVVDGRYFGLTATVRRRGDELCLPLPGPAGNSLLNLQSTLELNSNSTGAIFRAREQVDAPLSYRGARNVLLASLIGAGLPAMESSELRAACAAWLREQRLSEHDVRYVLGLSRVRSVDRLLARYSALNAQRLVHEHLQH